MKRPVVIIGLILLVLIVVQWLWPAQPPRISKTGDAGTSVEAGADLLAKADRTLAFPEEEAYQSVKERPLFFEGRRPPSNEPVEQAQEKPELSRKQPLPKHVLSAIVMVGSEAYAILNSGGKQDAVIRVRVGDDLEGWRVEQILDDRIVLKNGSEIEEKLLRAYAPVALPPVQSKKNMAPARAQGQKIPAQNGQAGSKKEAGQTTQVQPQTQSGKQIKRRISPDTEKMFEEARAKAAQRAAERRERLKRNREEGKVMRIESPYGRYKQVPMQNDG